MNGKEEKATMDELEEVMGKEKKRPIREEEIKWILEKFKSNNINF